MYNDKFEVIASNDDMSSLCKYSKLRVDSKTKWELSNYKDFYVKVESKDKGPLSTGVVFTEDNNRQASYVDFVTPEKNGGYYLQDANIDFKVYGNPATKDIKLQYRGINTASAVQTIDLGQTVKDEKSNTYKLAVKPKKSDFLSAFYSYNKYSSPNFIAVANSYMSGVTEAKIDGYIAYYNKEAYVYMDKSFYYNSPYDNSFRGYGTQNYNCMAYALGITNESIWPWSPQASGIGFEGVTRYFSKAGGYSTRDGYRYTEFSETIMPYAQAIYYEGHVAVVTAWDNNGIPTKIISKWGGIELIESSLEGLVAWGEPLIYMKGRQDN